MKSVEQVEDHKGQESEEKKSPEAVFHTVMISVTKKEIYKMVQIHILINHSRGLVLVDSQAFLSFVPIYMVDKKYSFIYSP